MLAEDLLEEERLRTGGCCWWLIEDDEDTEAVGADLEEVLELPPFKPVMDGLPSFQSQSLASASASIFLRSDKLVVSIEVPNRSMASTLVTASPPWFERIAS